MCSSLNARYIFRETWILNFYFLVDGVIDFVQTDQTTSCSMIHLWVKNIWREIYKNDVDNQIEGWWVFLISTFSFSSVQLLSHVRLFATPWIAACQASLSITNSRSSPRLRSIESVMPSSHLILCHPLLLLPPIPGHVLLIKLVIINYS